MAGQQDGFQRSVFGFLLSSTSTFSPSDAQSSAPKTVTGPSQTSAKFMSETESTVSTRKASLAPHSNSVNDGEVASGSVISFSSASLVMPSSKPAAHSTTTFVKQSDDTTPTSSAHSTTAPGRPSNTPSLQPSRATGVTPVTDAHSSGSKTASVSGTVISLTAGSAKPSNATSSNPLSRTSSVTNTTKASSVISVMPLHTEPPPTPIPQGIVSSNLNSTSAPSPTDSQNHDFFSDRGAVAGVFVTVSLVVLALLALIPTILGYCRRRRRAKYAAMQAQAHDNDMRYRRTSQMIAFGNRLSAGASGRYSFNSDDSHAASRDTHRSTEGILGGYHNVHVSRNVGSSASSSPTDSFGMTNGYSNVIPYPDARSPKATLPVLPEAASEEYGGDIPKPPQAPFTQPASNGYASDGRVPLLARRPPPNPFEDPKAVPRLEVPFPTHPARPILPPRNPSRPRTNSELRLLQSQQIQLPAPPKIFGNPAVNASKPSVAETSPSLYPPTLPPAEKADEEKYWQERDLDEHTSETAHASDKNTSALGLRFGHANSSETTIRAYMGSDQESEIVNNMNPFMEPGPLHRGTTAPITLPPKLRVHDGRYPLLTAKPSWERQ